MYVVDVGDMREMTRWVVLYGYLLGGNGVEVEVVWVGIEYIYVDMEEEGVWGG